MRIVLICFSLFSFFSFSQEKKVVDLLNKQLMKEIKNFEDEDSLKIIQPFHIDESKKLILEVEKYNSYVEQWEVIHATVALDKISGFIKDINVIFLTDDNDVLETITSYDKNRVLLKTNTHKTNLFFTQISKEINNESFGKAIVKALKKAGFEIDLEVWAD
ncbi:hypothetical protein FIA58_003075 [Flavobacterium jejuense]|uniref:TPM domain-containing protein n=1 Tax=Flavobacterium jejuense TaxID=1544455 RepID=A0ABX0IM31_9FLAO|nr:hypothetical protein [Flavobacterium jejuense]NHN24648.1 hypothetical protein [Flavobacterium jejuense]